MAALAWLAVAAHPARPWDLRPRDHELPGVPDPPEWPSLAVLVPARNEATTLPATLPALLRQDYPGPWRAVVADDRSGDGTGAVARRLARAAGADQRLEVVRVDARPPGWAGKVWALRRALERAEGAGGPAPELLLLTDADILHAPGSLRRLVAGAVHAGLDLDSRMARLRCASVAERLLIPPFVLFFLLLYPPRWANRAGGRVAAAAGGCALVRAAALRRAGGLEAIRGALIDDLALARRVKRQAGGRTRLAVSSGAVRSVRAHEDAGGVWRMVRRSAFTQLRRSHALLAGVLAALAVMFLAPPACVAAGAAAAAAGAPGALPALGAGLAGWGLMAAVAAPTMRAHGLRAARGLLLPLAGALYAGMTLDSALRGPREAGWR